MNAPLDVILKEYRARLEEIYGSRLIRLVLFGSRARGDADPESDIDVMIVLAGPIDHWVEIQRTSRATSDVSLKFDTVISRIFASPEDYAQERAPLYKNVRLEGVPV